MIDHFHLFLLIVGSHASGGAFCPRWQEYMHELWPTVGSQDWCIFSKGSMLLVLLSGDMMLTLYDIDATCGGSHQHHMPTTQNSK
jgi:hypothetical protein